MGNERNHGTMFVSEMCFFLPIWVIVYLGTVKVLHSWIFAGFLLRLSRDICWNIFLKWRLCWRNLFNSPIRNYLEDEFPEMGAASHWAKNSRCNLRLEDVEIFLIAIVALSKKSDPQYYETLVKNAKQHPDPWNNGFQSGLKQRDYENHHHPLLLGLC